MHLTVSLFFQELMDPRGNKFWMNLSDQFRCICNTFYIFWLGESREADYNFRFGSGAQVVCLFFFPNYYDFSRFRSICAALPLETSGFGQAAKG